MTEPTFGSLFAGIGGFDLGFERAGFRCAWQVEIDPFCRRVLSKHWPDVRRHDDVRTFPPTDPGEWRVDVICGGFPCQDISPAGFKVGIGGERSGLWSEFARVVRVVRPRFVVVENVADLLSRGVCRVLGDLAACGYDAEWDCIPAAAVGTPHKRDRLFLVAYPQCSRPVERIYVGGVGGQQEPAAWFAAWESTHSSRGVGSADGVPDRVDRLRGLGNAVVPQVAEWIARRIRPFLGG